MVSYLVWNIRLKVNAIARMRCLVWFGRNTAVAH